MASVPATTADSENALVETGGNSNQTNSSGESFSGFGNLDLFRQLGLMIGLAASVAIGFAVVLWSQGSNFQPVFGNMQGYDPAAIMETLDVEAIDYRVDPNSGVILVPADQIADIRLRLAAAGVTRYDGTGYELLDQDQALGTSQYMEANRIKRSQEGELQRTISNFRNVQSARVHIAIPERSVFVRSSRKPTASVFLVLNAGSGLNDTQIEAIANLVASSVPELSADDVTIVDQRGNLLSRKDTNMGLEIADQQFDYTRKFEENLVNRVSSILRPIVGIDGFQAEVTADIDFTHLEQAAESYDPATQVLRSEQTMEEQRSGDDFGGGIPGALSNQPPVDGVDAAVDQGAEFDESMTSNRRVQATRNFELGRQVSYTNHDPVAVNRVSVAVVLDDKPSLTEEEAMPWSAEEILQIETLVRDAVGFNELRGDSVTVINNSFARIAEMPMEEIPIWQQGWIQSLIKQVAAGLFVLLLVFGVLRPVLRNLAQVSSESRQLAVAAAGAMYIYYYGLHSEDAETAEQEAEELEGEENSIDPEEITWQDVTPVDAIGLEAGYRLISLVDKTQGGELLARIKGIRKKLSQDLGFLIPSVHIRDNLDLTPNEYKISLSGVTVGSAEVFPEKDMAINPGQVYGKIQGIETKDPAFGLEALWIEKAQKEQAESLGYTVVDASTVIATHLNNVLQSHAHEILGHEEVQQLLSLLAQQSPKLAEELPEILNSNIVLKVLQNLLAEQVPIRDIRTIAETLAAQGGKSQDSVILTAAVRVSLSRVIAQSVYGDRPELPVITIDSDLEQILLESLHQSAQSNGDQEPTMAIEPKLAESLQKSLVASAQKQEVAGDPAVLLVAAPLRPMLSRFARYTIEGLKVLSYQEIPDNKQVTIVASVGNDR